MNSVFGKVATKMFNSPAVAESFDTYQLWKTRREQLAFSPSWSYNRDYTTITIDNKEFFTENWAYELEDILQEYNGTHPEGGFTMYFSMQDMNTPLLREIFYGVVDIPGTLVAEVWKDDLPSFQVFFPLHGV